MSLPFSMVRILTKDYDLYLIKGSKIKGVENICSFGIDYMPCLSFLKKKLFDPGKIRFLKF
jgi:hypothetical protein